MRKGPAPLDVLEQGICNQPGGPDFFSQDPSEVRRAKNICGMCPVKFQCLQYALAGEPETYGVWGGVDQWELRIVAAVTPHGDPVRKARPAKCPFCRTTKNVTEARELTNRGSRAFCSGCGLVWRRAKSYTKKERTRRLREDAPLTIDDVA